MFKISQTNDGEDYTIEIDAQGAKFSYTLHVFNKGNRTYIDYTNSDGIEYNLLDVTDGQITNEIPKEY